MTLGLFGGQSGMGEILVVLLLILLLFGSRKVPELARSLGRSISEFKKGREEGGEPAEKKDKADGDKSSP